VRFDDRLATALGQAADSPAARQAVWRQLVDLLGQSAADDTALRAEALARLRAWRGEVSPSSRQSAAIMLAGRDVPADLVEFFAEDLTAVSAPLLASVQLAEEDWIRLIPRVSPVARALLRHRRDLPEGAVRLLQAYGPTDLVIPAPEPVETEAADVSPGHDIQALRARINAMRDRRQREQDAPPAEAPVAAFDYETGPDGLIHWCDLPQRGGVLGLSIAEPGVSGQQGVDGQAAGAFRQRAPFRSSRLWVAHGAAAGAWTLSGVPNFDPATGRFLGYRGSARRPGPGERAEPPGLLGFGLTGDSARQFAHEMRTPLNAIAGFAEMIQRQMLGPASADYRDRACAILAESQRIGMVLDELEEAARLEASAAAGQAEEVDCGLLLARVVSALGPGASDKGVPISLSIAPNCAPALIDPGSAGRMITRLMSACLGLAAPGERLEVEVAPGQGLRAETVISVSRPRSIEGLSESALFDASDIADAQEPPLGLGFGLRLVRHIAEANGGRLQIDEARFNLLLPSATAAPARAGSSADAGSDWTEWLRRQPAGGACQDARGSAIAADPAGPVAQR
jgi:hypothetical protein